VPSVSAEAETRPIDAATAQRNVLLLRAVWDILEKVVAASKAEPRKGPRGGRDRDEIWRHVIEAERAYARKIGVRHKPFEMNDKSALQAMQEEIAARLRKSSPGEPLVSGGQLRGSAHGLACRRSRLGERGSSAINYLPLK
jgi:hypothetical protein